MEGESGQENPLQLRSLTFAGNSNYGSYGSGDDQNQLFPMSDGVIESQPDTLSLSQWLHCSKTPCSYVEFLTGNSGYLENAPIADLMESVALPGGGIDAVERVSEVQRGLLNNDLEKVFAPRDNDSSSDMDAWKLKQCTCMLNSNFHEASVSFLKLQDGGSIYSKFQTYAQNQTFGTQEPSGNDCNSFHFRSKYGVQTSGFLSKPRNRRPRQGTSATDRQRRLRIADKLKALRGLLQNSEGSQTSVVDDVIGHIKFLQLQIKELSRSRLGGEPTSHPFIFLEGYGHYILHEKTMNGPLEDLMGNLLEMNPSEATQLLESRGLYIMPISFAEGFCQAA
ncbi:transcription factor bHLH66 [Carica papaya]|uniref:transcription factor bHLH66 n=1 Tax=Carica papaya TaxID=3649 RepID=UPI000B8D0570|nr:transcription factor bHLH66 [Carica papaya]XP_021897940.1 transcription factor bHLH66 [Carica papaya]